MFTVILLSDAAKAIFDRSRVYFEPFVEAGSIAFCEWNQHSRARNLLTAVPDLPGIIRGKSEWRAIVVDHPREDKFRGQTDVENPFDFVDNEDTALSVDDSKQPLIRLAHILLGYPQLTAKGFQPVVSYTDSETGQKCEISQEALVLDWVSRHPDQVEDRDKAQLESGAEAQLIARFFPRAVSELGTEHDHVQRNFREISYSREEERRHEELTAQYRLKEVSPSEVIFVATRGRIEEDERSTLRRAWTADSHHVTSRFIERNDYPPMSRFAVYDLLEMENSGYGQDELRFWLSVLSVATNLLPPSGLQADRVYRVGIDLSVSRLTEMLNDHVSALAMIRDHIDTVISSPREMPALEVENLLAPVEVDVQFDDIGGEELEVSRDGYGLASDTPRLEVTRWRESFHRLEGDAQVFVRKPRRALVRAVGRARDLARTGSREPIILNDIERDELESELLRRATDLTTPATSEILDKRRFRSVLDAHNRVLERETTERMELKPILTASGIAIGIWLLALVPYVIQATRKGTESFVDGLLVTIVAIVIIVAAVLVTLFVMRRALRRRIANLNDDLRAEVANVQTGAFHYADYLSDFVTYMRGRRVLSDSAATADHSASRLRNLRAVNETVRSRIQAEKAVILSLGGTIEVQRRQGGLTDFDPEDPAKVRQIFRFHIGDSLMPFNGSGEKLNAPYDFVSGIQVHQLALFERESENDHVTHSLRHENTDETASS